MRFVVVPDPAAHLFHVTLELESPAKQQVFRLPSWIRGSYLVRDFAKHVVALRAQAGGAVLAIERIDKRSFRVDSGGRPLRLDYSVYAYDNSVRKAYVDHRRGFFNGSSLFYCPNGLENARFEVDIRRPDAAAVRDWKVATAMSPQSVDADGFGTYAATGYEELIDHPVEMAGFLRVDFDVDSVPHSLVLAGRCEVDAPRLVADITKICHAQREMFGQQPDRLSGLERYLFLTQVTGNGYGGLEHRASSALVAARDALPRPGQPALRKGYRGFLGLVSHEYFHLWNVKRITPQRFAESDLAREAYSQDLWAYEGVTSYYDDLMLLRAGIIDAPAYLDLLAESATRLQRTPGRRTQSLADASFDAWIKYYQPDENSPNQGVSYYIKGALASLCLDLRLRRDSGITLDDVMRALWQRYGAKGEPVPEGGLEQVATELSGLDLRAFFDLLLRSTEELPLAELLADFGVRTQLRAATGAGDEGGRSDAKAAGPSATLGILLRAGDTVVGSVFAGGPAAQAGLAGGDQIVALDELRVTAANWSKLLETLTPQRAVKLHYFRGDELMQMVLTPAPVPLDTWSLTLVDAGDEVLARRRAWLGSQ
jgi:predicted metalloprotease with PDZ domain